MSKKSGLLVLFSVLFSLSFAPQQPAEAQAPLVFTHATIIDTSGGPNQTDMTVMISGDRIAVIQPSAEFPLPKGAQVIDAAGKFLIPGLWDMHVHWYDARYLPLFIANGVTGVRQMWGFPVHFQWRDEIAKGLLLGPRQAIAGIPIDGAEPFYPGVISVGNENEARQAVRRVKESGADFIEVDGGLSREAYFAIADESKKLGIPFAGGVPRSVRAAEASEAGQKSIEYLGALGPGLYLDCSNNEDELRERGQKSREGFSAGQPRTREQLEDIRQQQEIVFETYDADKAAALFAIFVKNGTWQCPTLTVQRGFSYLDDTDFMADPRLKYMPKRSRVYWEPQNNAFVSSNTAEDWAMMKKVLAKKLEIIKPMHRAGVKFIAGTDLANPYCFPGFSLHDELDLLVKGGLTPLEALQAATSNAAEFLGLKNSLGTVEAGKIADLVLLEANPLVDIGNTRKIAAVVVNGKYFSRSSLDEMLAKIETVANLASISEPKEAIEIFKFNVELHPRSFNAYDSLAEAYLNNGDQGPAIENFEKSLELNRFNWNAAEKLKKLKKK